MKQKILFMTVGTGLDEEKRQSLANGLTYSIIQNSPQHVIFFGTKESEKTIELIKKQYYTNEGEKLDSYEFVEIDNPDDFNTCYDIINQKINEYKDEKIVLDYTSGTKTMSVTIVTLAIINKQTLSLIKGQRGKTRTVISNTEELKIFDAYKVYDKEKYEEFEELVLDMADELTPQISTFIEETKFPKFKE